MGRKERPEHRLVIARNDLGEPLFATPAIARGTLYLRTRGHLVAVAGPRR